MDLSTRLVIAVLFAATVVSAQLTTGSVTGTVTDSSNAAVRNAKVILTNSGTGVAHQAASDDSGNFRFLQLPVGTYNLDVNSAGFKAFRRDGIIVETDRSLAVPVNLQIGSVNETVVVSAGTPLLDPNTSSLGTVMDQKKVEDLPLNGRNPMNLANLIPTVRGIGGFGGLVTSTWGMSAVTIGGSSPLSNGYLVDGIANDKMIDAGASTLLPVESTEEFKVLTNNMSAEFGRTGGGIISVISKSGTNQFHGSLFEYLRNAAINANEFFANKAGVPVLPFVFNQFGGSVGGPIKKDKLFFFFNYEGVRESITTDSVVTSPTLLQRAGDFSQTFTSTGALITIYDPTTTRPDPAHPGSYMRDPFPGNVIPPNRLNNVATNVLKYYPLPNQPGLAGSQAQNLFMVGSKLLNNDTYTGKVDYNINAQRRISGRYTSDDLHWNQPNYFHNAADVDGRAVLIPHHSGSVSYTDSLSPSLLLDAKAGVNRENEHYYSPSQGIDITTLGFPSSLAQQAQHGYAKGPGFPRFTVTDATAFGRPDNLGNPSSTSSASLAVTKILGGQTLKAGYEYRNYRRNDWGTSSPYGSYTFTRGFTQGPNPLQASTNAGYGVASLLLGDPSSASAGYTTDNTKTFGYEALFLQDDWKVTRRLVLNLGLRWEYETAVHDRYNVLSNFDPNVASPLVVPGLQLKGGLAFPGKNGLPDGLIDPSFKNFGPRVGFAYQATDNIVLRGGYGIMYVPTLGAAYPSTGFTITTPMTTTIDGGLTPYNNLSNPFPTGIQTPTGSSLGAGTGIGTPISGELRNAHRGYVQEWNYTVQYQPKANWLVEAAWVGNHGVGLQMYSVPMDILSSSNFALGTALQQSVANPFYGIIPTGPLSAATITRSQLLLPYPQFTSVDGGYQFRGASTYNALALKLEKRFSMGFSLLASYTFSKMLDLGDNTLQARPGEAIGTGVQNWNNLGAEKSLSLVNVPQRVVLTALWSIPTGNLQNRILKSTLGGWQLNAISTLQSGTPIALAASTTGGGNRPNVVPGVKDSADHQSLAQWFNIAAFSTPAAYTFGNVSRTLPDVLGPGLVNVDLSVLRTFPIKEHYRLQFRAEAFNLNNTPQFANPGNAINSNTFGVVTSTLNQPRVLQFALRVDF
ncbi:MAG: Cna B-type protein [Bryobacterales bacterium]|nr:Cna B-type protein [Bryobacterales bacterium]